MYYMFIAEGFEETEALATLDMLRRAEIDIKTVGVGNSEITGTHGINVKTDTEDKMIDFTECDGIILPGGMPGTENLYASETVIAFVKFCFENRKLIASICAAPIIPGRLGLLNGKRVVCYPGFENCLIGADIVNAKSVTDDIFITAKGAGCVFEFSHKLIEYICNKNTADRIISEIQHDSL